jgi:hypothetical protein
MDILIRRTCDNGIQTLGNGLCDGFHFKTLELPWRNNERRVSCIPIGEYEIIKHNSPKFGLTYWVQNVTNRSEILIHKGNYHTDILGCILVGSAHKDINNDRQVDVINSAATIKKLLSLNATKLIII